MTQYLVVAASDLGVACLPMSHKKDARYIYVTNAIILLFHTSSRNLGSRLLK